MKRLLPLALLMLAAAPLRAEAPGDVGKGFNLLEEGGKLLLRGLADKIQPEFEAMMRDIGPAIESLGVYFDDLGAYRAPEIQPNGDIIIRRKVPLVPLAPGTVPGGEIEI